LSGRSRFVAFVPSEFIRYSLGTPVRSLTKAIDCPVFGFQAGEVLAPLAKVRRLRSPPPELMEKSSGLPAIEEEKTILEPSGDHEVALLVPLKRGKLTTFPASTE